jgi:hypothetical protein
MIAAIYARKSTEQNGVVERDGASTSATLPAASGQVSEVTSGETVLSDARATGKQHDARPSHKSSTSLGRQG